MGSCRVLTAAVLMLGFRTPADAQRPIQFDAATVKPAPEGPGSSRLKGGPGTNDPGRVTWQKVWLRDLVVKAFHVDPRNLSGPTWIGGNGRPFYTLTATMPTDTSEHDFEIMLQNFLIEQFRMKVHHEPKEFPSYDLILAPGGAKLKVSTDPYNPGAGMLLTDQKIDSEGFLVLPPGHGVAGTVMNGMHETFQQFSIAELAEFLISPVTPQGDRTHYVVDKTGLTDRYDFKLKYDDRYNAIQLGPNVQAALGTQGAPGAQDGLEPGSGLPDIFTAVEQQLGLRLVKAKDIPMDTLVIDEAEKTPVGQ